MGIELALGTRLRPLLFCEIEAYLIALMVGKMEAGVMAPAPILTDIKSLPGIGGSFLNGVDFLTGGFPCQSFSAAGKRLTTEDPRHLYPFLAESISVIKPRYVFLENVEGIISAKCRNQPGAEDGESVLLYVLRDLESRGYTCTWGLYSAKEVGAPHRRNRVFILGYLADAEHDGRIIRQGNRKVGGVEQQQGRSDEPKGTEQSTGGGSQSSIRGIVAFTVNAGLEGLGAREGSPSKEVTLSASGSNYRWPAGPRQPQHSWEPPRVIPTKPRLGRGVDGSTYRLDQLRALGNGVVPMQAARAFSSLIQDLG